MSVSSTGLRLGCTMKTLGQTWSRISAVTNSACEALRTLKPAMSSSRANVSEPPLLTALVVVPPPEAAPLPLLLPPPPQADKMRTAAATAAVGTSRMLRRPGLDERISPSYLVTVRARRRAAQSDVFPTDYG